MIVALLFLILFALLFPKALKFLLFLMFLGGIMILGEVHAAPIDCSGPITKIPRECVAAYQDKVPAPPGNPTGGDLIMMYRRAKTSCNDYGNGGNIHTVARGEMDCKHLGYIISIMQDYGCSIINDRWQCPTH
jgi:hypothetical protein